MSRYITKSGAGKPASGACKYYVIELKHNEFQIHTKSEPKVIPKQYPNHTPLKVKSFGRRESIPRKEQRSTMSVVLLLNLDSINNLKSHSQLSSTNVNISTSNLIIAAMNISRMSKSIYTYKQKKYA